MSGSSETWILSTGYCLSCSAAPPAFLPRTTACTLPPSALAISFAFVAISNETRRGWPWVCSMKTMTSFMCLDELSLMQEFEDFLCAGHGVGRFEDLALAAGGRRREREDFGLRTLGADRFVAADVGEGLDRDRLFLRAHDALKRRVTRLADRLGHARQQRQRRADFGIAVVGLALGAHGRPLDFELAGVRESRNPEVLRERSGHFARDRVGRLRAG